MITFVSLVESENWETWIFPPLFNMEENNQLAVLFYMNACQLHNSGKIERFQLWKIFKHQFTTDVLKN